LSSLRIGLCTIAFRDRRLPEVLELAHSIGYEGVELWGREPHICEAFDARRVAEARAQIRASGLELVSYSPYVYFSSLKEDGAQQEFRTALGFLRVAQGLGSPRMRVYAGRKASGEATAQDWEYCTRGLRALAKAAEASEVTLCVETHGGTLADTAETTARVLSAVDSPSLRVLFDPVNLWPEDSAASARALRSHIELVHLKNRPDRAGSLPLLDEGTVDFREALVWLKESGYEGFVDVEFVSQLSPEAAAAHDYAFLKRVAASAEARDLPSTG